MQPTEVPFKIEASNIQISRQAGLAAAYQTECPGLYAKLGKELQGHIRTPNQDLPGNLAYAMHRLQQASAMNEAAARAAALPNSTGSIDISRHPMIMALKAMQGDQSIISDQVLNAELERLAEIVYKEISNRLSGNYSGGTNVPAVVVTAFNTEFNALNLNVNTVTNWVASAAPALPQQPNLPPTYSALQPPAYGQSNSQPQVHVGAFSAGAPYKGPQMPQPGGGLNNPGVQIPTTIIAPAGNPGFDPDNLNGPGIFMKDAQFIELERIRKQISSEAQKLTYDASTGTYLFPDQIKVIEVVKILDNALNQSVINTSDELMIEVLYKELSNLNIPNDDANRALVMRFLGLRESYDPKKVAMKLQEYGLNLGFVIELMSDFYLTGSLRSRNVLNATAIFDVLNGHNPPISNLDLVALLDAPHADNLRAVLAIILNADEAAFTDALKQLASTRPDFQQTAPMSTPPQLNPSLNINFASNLTHGNETGFKEFKTLLESLNDQAQQGTMNYETALENLFKEDLIRNAFRRVILEFLKKGDLTLEQADEWLTPLNTGLIDKLIEKGDPKDIWNSIYVKIINATSVGEFNVELEVVFMQLVKTGNASEKTANPAGSADVSTIRDAFYSAKEKTIFLDDLTKQTGLSEEEIGYMREFDERVEANKPDSPNNNQWIKSAYEDALELIDGSNISLLNKIKIIIAIVTNYVPEIDFPDTHAFLAAAIIKHNIENTYEFPTDSELEQLAKDLNINLESLKNYI